MTNRETLLALIHTVEEYYLQLNGKKIKQKEIAERLGITNKYLSNIVNGQQKTSDEIIEDFKIRFKEEINGMTYERALLEVLIKEFAELKSSKEKGVSKDDVISDIENKASAILKDGNSK